MIKGLEHTAIASPDPERLARWYVDHLEFVINFRYGTNVFVKAPNGGMLEIIVSEGERADRKLKDPGLAHLAIEVDEFDATHRKLREKGVTFLGDPVNLDGNRLVFFTDADGNYVHLVQRPSPLP
jgi:glyoxylase I family protein